MDSQDPGTILIVVTGAVSVAAILLFRWRSHTETNVSMWHRDMWLWETNGLRITQQSLERGRPVGRPRKRLSVSRSRFRGDRLSPVLPFAMAVAAKALPSSLRLWLGR